MKNCCNNQNGFNLIGLSGSLAIAISEILDDDELSIFSAFLTSLADNLAMVATSKSLSESDDNNNSSSSSTLDIDTAT